MKNKILRILSIGWMVAGMASEASAQTLHLDRADIQNFEQSYESWVRELVHQIMPKSNATVIAEFNYSGNQDLIQSYEEKRAASHLPGLPEVTDLDVHPLQNPIYELISEKKIKVIFDQELSADQSRLLKEFLNSKLAIDSAQGDRIALDHIYRSGEGSLRGSFSKSKAGRLTGLAILIAAIGTFGILHLRNRKQAKNKKFAAEKVNLVYEQINPVRELLKIETPIFNSFIANQDLTLLIEAMAHAPVTFIQAVLKAFEGEQRINLFELFQDARLEVTAKRSRYSQLFLLAKVNDDLKLRALQEVDVMGEAFEQIRNQRENMNQSLKELKSLYGNTNEELNEVDYEQSL